MPIDKHTRRESEPPAGGIFLPKFSYLPTSEVLANLDADVERSRKARAHLAQLAINYPDGNPLVPGIFTLAAKRRNDYVKKVIGMARLRESTVIDCRIEDPLLRRRVKKILHPGNPLLVFVEDQRKWREWLGTPEEQEAYLCEVQVAPDYEPPHALLKAEVTYTETTMEQANIEADRISLIHQRSDTYAAIILAEWPDLATNIGQHYYEVHPHPFDKTPHLVRIDGEDTKDVHFTGAGYPEEAYQTMRHASTSDHILFLQDCLVEFNPEA